MLNNKFDGAKAIRQAVEDYSRHISTTSKKALKENEEHGNNTGTKNAEKAIAVMNDISEEFITTLAQDSWAAKTELRNLFRKSPNWNEELQAIVLKGTCTPEPNYRRIETWIWKILSPLEEKGEYDKRRDALTASKFFIEPEYRSRHIDALNKVAPKAYREGKKITRIFKAFCDAIGITDETKGSKFQELFAKITDELLAKEYEFQLYISINPAHFLTMSNPKYDGRGDTMVSCHSFNSTEYIYNCGCTGYARDEYTFIAFTASDDKNPETLNNRKTSRQIFVYKPNSGCLLQSRMYTTKSGESYGGVNEDTAEGKAYRAIIQREISELEKASPIWETDTYTYNKFSVRIGTGKGFGGYADWSQISGCAKISVRFDCKDKLSDFDCAPDKKLKVGTYGLCIKCGKTISHGLYCDHCAGRCEHCGRKIAPGVEHEVYDSDGNRITVCDHCFEVYYRRCEICGEYHHKSNITVTGDGFEVCRDCLENNFKRCEDCGEYYRKGRVQETVDIHGEKIFACDICRNSGHCERGTDCDCCGRRFPAGELTLTADGDSVCQECLESRYGLCDHCGEIHALGGITREATCDGEIIYLCDHCAESGKYETCDDCGRLAPAGTLIDIGGGSRVCQHCLDHNYTQCADCGEYCENENLHEVEDRYGDTIYICDSCAEHYVTCDYCGQLIYTGNATYISDYVAVCENCLDRHYNYCEECGEYYPVEDVRYAINRNGDQISICDCCAEYEGYETCAECGCYVHPDIAKTAEDSEGDKITLCPDCYEYRAENQEGEAV